MRKRSFSLVINLETDDEDFDLAREQDRITHALRDTCEDPAFSEYVSYVTAAPGEEWQED